MLHALKERFFAGEEEGLCQEIDRFIETHGEQLVEIFQQYANYVQASPLSSHTEGRAIGARNLRASRSGRLHTQGRVEEITVTKVPK